MKFQRGKGRWDVKLGKKGESGWVERWGQLESGVLSWFESGKVGTEEGEVKVYGKGL